MQTYQLLVESYPQLNHENHVVISEEETAVIYYYKVWLSDLEISGHCSPEFCRILWQWHPGGCLVKWCYVSDRKVSFTQSTLFRNHLRSSTKKFLNKTCAVLSLDVQWLLNFQYPQNGRHVSRAAVSNSNDQLPCSRSTVLQRTRRASEDDLHKYVKAYLNASVLLSSNYNKHPQSILWDKWNLSYPRICQV